MMHNVTFVPSSNAVVFYPIGNTPAVNLLSHHSPQPDKNAKTSILSLACGDARSILYSLWCEGKPGAEKFNFTCCDLEPAVFARNVLLLSLMLENADKYGSSTSDSPIPQLAVIWNLWYHLFLPENDLEVLREQSLKLLSYSETPEKWASGPFSCINFVSLQSLDELRKIWTKYTLKRSPIDEASYEVAMRSEVTAINKKLYDVGGTSMTFYAGVHWEKGLKTMNKGLRGYWKTGVAGGNKADIAALGPDGRGFVNPLMTVSSVSETFAVHNTSDPLTGFHLASVWDGKADEERDVEAMVTLAKIQFQQWSKAFVEYALKDSVQVNIFYGDAVTFCHELAARTTNAPDSAVVTRLYTTQWSSKPLLLDGDGAKSLPMFFDIIDTSNLADWVGLSNILLPTSLILARKDTSALYTETFRLTAEEPDDDLYEHLFMDIDLASLFFGIAPLGHILGYNTENNWGEDIVHVDNPNRYRIRVPWKFVLDHHTKNEIVHPTRDRRVKFDADELAEIFFEVYLKIFCQENLEEAMAKFQSQAAKGKNPMHSSVFNRFSRLSFATLVQHTMRNIESDWKMFFAQLMDKIEKDKTLHIGQSCMLDLVLQLSLCGALDDAFTKIDPNPNPRQFIQVTLVVPRSELKIFDKLGGAPGIHLNVFKNKSNNLFFSIDCFFGRIEKNSDGSWGEVVEDQEGWAGSSDLIITTPVPPELVETGKFVVALQITMSMHAMEYFKVLGPELSVYASPSKNKKRVFTSDLPPRIPKSRFENDNSRRLSSLNLGQDQSVATSASTATGPLIFQAKWDIPIDSEEATALGKAAVVTVPDNSPCSIFVKIGDKYGRRLVFPFPVDAEKAKLRIARKNLWIEATVPAASTLVPGGYDLTPFPVVIEDDAQPSSWSLPRVDLAKQPRITSMVHAGWFVGKLDQFLSVREKKILSKGPDIPPNSPFRTVLPFWKKTLYDIIVHVLDIPELKVFLLAGPDLGPKRAESLDTFIIANCLRHGRETGALILDAWVIPMISGRKFAGVGKVQIFNLDDQETFIWKHIFPAAVESCRRTWTHKPGCEYLKEKRVPLALERMKSPICSCGEGQDVEDYPIGTFVEDLKKYATRISLPTLSAVSYVEAMDPRIQSGF